MQPLSFEAAELLKRSLHVRQEQDLALTGIAERAEEMSRDLASNVHALTTALQHEAADRQRAGEAYNGLKATLARVARYASEGVPVPATHELCRRNPGVDAAVSATRVTPQGSDALAQAGLHATVVNLRQEEAELRRECRLLEDQLELRARELDCSPGPRPSAEVPPRGSGLTS